jgi:hypothetical protein
MAADETGDSTGRSADGIGFGAGGEISAATGCSSVTANSVGIAAGSCIASSGSLGSHNIGSGAGAA